MIDLHTHSKASDGHLSPKELVSYAAEKNISVLALTDHDTTDGLWEAQEAAKDIQFVPGIELNIDWPTGEFHLLGLGLNSTAPSLKKIITDLKEQRQERNKSIITKMQAEGFDISQEAVMQRFPHATLGRPHIAAYLVEKKYCKTLQQAFDKYLGKGRPFYVHRAGADLSQSIEAIKESGGVPVLAHPLSLYVSWGKMYPLLEELKNQGIEGLEAYHPGARISEGQRLEEMGHRLGFFITGGSDFHGEAVRKDRKMGYGTRGLKLEDRLWTEELLPHINLTHYEP